MSKVEIFLCKDQKDVEDWIRVKVLVFSPKILQDLDNLILELANATLRGRAIGGREVRERIDADCICREIESAWRDHARREQQNFPVEMPGKMREEMAENVKCTLTLLREMRESGRDLDTSVAHVF